mmetsp:Transcript_42583/g.71075  ORF Transcript_42583/g.71075 Transcript_42583/m.71075 type:complete len:257 (+) Transcript_42583:541-1311(+)
MGARASVHSPPPTALRMACPAHTSHTEICWHPLVYISVSPSTISIALRPALPLDTALAGACTNSEMSSANLGETGGPAPKLRTPSVLESGSDGSWRVDPSELVCHARLYSSPFTPFHARPVVGSTMSPAAGNPSISRPIIIQKSELFGLMKHFVPSRGSTNHTRPLVDRAAFPTPVKLSSEIMVSAGKASLMCSRMTSSAARSASVTGPSPASFCFTEFVARILGRASKTICAARLAATSATAIACSRWATLTKPC